MFESVKKAIFGRGKPEESAVPQAVDAVSAETVLAETVPTEAVPTEAVSARTVSVEVGSEAVESDASSADGVDRPGEGSKTAAADVESACEASSEEQQDLGRAYVEGSEQDDVEVEAAEDAAAATEQPTEQSADRSAGVESSINDVDRAKAEAAENYDKYIRAVAELENYKKRALRERADVLRYAGESLARDMLEIADHLQRALAQDMEGVRDDFVKGLQLILDRFQAIMEQHQVRGESSVGTAFDPVKHEALASVPTSDHPAGTVLEEFKRAYYFKDKLLRPAQVVVAKEDEPQPQ